MRYLIITTETDPFLTDNYSYENDFNSSIGMIVFDLQKMIWTNDGIYWENIEENHL